MKKLYFFALLAYSLITVSSADAQVCTPDPQYASTPGIFPDTTTNFVNGTVGTPYSQSITVTVPQDTTVPPFTLSFDSAHLVSITNLPPGLTYQCAPGICTWNGGTSGCAVITGTPTTAGTYSLNISVNAYVGGSTSPIPQNVNGYRITILPAVGIAENYAVAFEVKQNSPNPANGKTVIKYTVPTDDKVKVSVYNMLGKAVSEKKVDASKGENEYEIDARNLPGGMYFYTVEYKGKTVTRRMLVSNF